MASSHDLWEPRLRIRASGYGGSGYGIPTEDRGVLKFPGVTTVLNVLPKGGVTQWAVDNTVAYMLANIDSILDSYDDSALFKKYRFYHNRTPKVDDPDVDPFNHHVGVLHDAAETGTFVHDWIAANVSELIEADFEKPDQVSAITSFLEWLDDHEIDPHVIEATVVNETLGYAGTFDHVWDVKCLHKGEPCIPGADKEPQTTFIDVKTSKAIYDSHVAQLAALTNAEYMMQESEDGTGIPHKTKKWGTTYWNKLEMPKFQHVAILKCRFDDFDSDGNDVPAITQLTVISPAKLETGLKIFKSALEMQHALKEFKDLEK